MAKAVGAGDQRRRRTEPDLDEHVQALVAALLVVIALAALAEVLAGRAVSSVAERPHDSTWEAPARIGEAALARGDAPAARRAYLTALFRARGERSVIGVLRAAQGFKALGDRDVVDQTLAMAVALGGYESGGPRNAPPRGLRSVPAQP